MTDWASSDLAPRSSRLSPNHGPRRPKRIDILLLHYTGMLSADGSSRSG